MSSRRLLLALPLALACSGRSPAHLPDGSASATPDGGVVTAPPATPVAPVPPATSKLPAAIALPAAPADPPRTGNPPRSMGSGNGLTILAMHGLFRLDPPLAGEPTIDGLVQVELNGSTPPADTTVELNGVPLVPRQAGGALHAYWAVDPAGAQPVPDASGHLTVTARTGSLVRSVPVPCPADLEVSSSFTSARSLALAWKSSDLMVNEENPFPTDLYASAHVRDLEPTTFAVREGELAQSLLPRDTHELSIDVGETGAAGYLAELRWQGPFVSDGDSRAFCGRVKRLAFAR